MHKSSILFLIVAINSFGQDKDLDINKYLRGRDQAIVNSILKAGQKDFVFVDRMEPGLVFFDKYDSCNNPSFVQFILSKNPEPGKFDFVKYNSCGQQIRVVASSKALKFFEDNRNQIRMDSIDERVNIDHTVLYGFYEFKGGSLKTYKYFCKKCVDLDEEEVPRRRNQNLIMYKFFDELDKELSKLISD